MKKTMQRLLAVVLALALLLPMGAFAAEPADTAGERLDSIFISLSDESTQTVTVTAAEGAYSGLADQQVTW